MNISEKQEREKRIMNVIIHTAYYHLFSIIEKESRSEHHFLSPGKTEVINFETRDHIDAQILLLALGIEKERITHENFKYKVSLKGYLEGDTDWDYVTEELALKAFEELLKQKKQEKDYMYLIAKDGIHCDCYVDTKELFFRVVYNKVKLKPKKKNEEIVLPL